ncbi:deoxyribodipyrimidine photo-lyase [Klenkia terrae]|uniref:deoxyribodipyrimidine photo-lyase n=1 Tax=Klenkia terrae TaxID=1052259 RepID=UPI0036101E3A
MPTAIHWFRRDLRLADNPALLAARDAGDVLPLFVVDPALWEVSGDPRKHFLAGCLADLHEATDGRLVIRHGTPQDVVPALAREVDAASVHVAGDTGPYGRRRDAAVEKALGDVDLVRTGSAYAIAPGTITKDDGDPLKVFTPFKRRWLDHGWPDPAPARARSAGPARTPRTCPRPPTSAAPRCSSPARPPPASAGGSSGTSAWWTTTASATALTWTPPAGCPRTCTWAPCTRAPCCTTSPGPG